MTPERWQQIDQLFHSALEHEPSGRTAFLAEACTDDEALRVEVESLIGSHEQSDSFIEAPAADLAAGLLAGRKTQLTAGQAVGPYKIVSLLGVGGMGEVYLADDTRLNRKIARLSYCRRISPLTPIVCDALGGKRARPRPSITQTSLRYMRLGSRIPRTSSPPSSLTARHCVN